MRGRALQQGKEAVAGQGFFVRDIDPTKSRTIIASQASLQYAH